MRDDHSSLWDRKYGTQRDPSENEYHNQPTHNPLKGHSFAVASLTCGILSLTLTCLTIFPIVLSSFAFLFAALSCRKGKRRHIYSLYGMITGGMGIASAIFMMVQLLVTPLPGTELTYLQMIQQYLGQLQ